LATLGWLARGITDVAANKLQLRHQKSDSRGRFTRICRRKRLAAGIAAKEKRIAEIVEALKAEVKSENQLFDGD